MYWPLSEASGVWVFRLLSGLLLVIPFLFIGALIESKWIIRRLKNGGIVVEGWNWFGPEVQRSMLQEFTDYLTDIGLYSPEALDQLINNSRDEIEARWRPISVISTVLTLVVALFIAYYQPVFSQFLQLAVKSGGDIRQVVKIGVIGVLIVLLFGLMLYPNVSPSLRHCCEFLLSKLT